MFEFLLLVAVVLITISQLLPEDEIDDQQRTRSRTHPTRSARYPSTHTEKGKKTEQPCRDFSGRAV